VETVTSRDGIAIAYSRSGKGPPLVLVHGTAEDQARWIPILRPLAEHFTVYAIDRRGRNESGDSAAYSLQAEASDILGLVDALGEPVHLLGHSYGALCLMEAALRNDHLGKLVLYEPPMPLKGDFYAPGSIDGLEALLAQGDKVFLPDTFVGQHGEPHPNPLHCGGEGAGGEAPQKVSGKEGDKVGVITTFLRDFLHLSPLEMELLTYLPIWPGRVAAAHTIPRELRQIQGYRFQPERFTGLMTPTLLLLGGESPSYMRDAVEALHQALPNSQVVVMPGQQHNAISAAPAVFAQEVLRFLLEE
jgi:pimeloyl-ACP methyl ester carboxylesterase